MIYLCITALGLSRQTTDSDNRDGYLWRFDSPKLPTIAGDAASVDLALIEVGISVGCWGEVFLGSQGDFELNGGANGGVELAVKQGLPGGVQAEGGIHASGQLSLSGAWSPGVALERGQLALDIAGEAAVQVPFRAVLSLDPAIGNSINMGIDGIPPLAHWVDETGYVRFGMSQRIGGDVDFLVTPAGSIEIEQAIVRGGFGASIMGNLGREIYLQAGMSGGGEVTIILTPESIAFDSFEGVVDGYVAAGIALFGWESELGDKMVWPIVWPEHGPTGLATLSDTDKGVAPARLSTISRAYSEADYAVFHGGESTRPSAPVDRPGLIAPLGEVTEEVFVQNVFPRTTAALNGTGPNDLWIVYVHDNPELPQVQGTQIKFSSHDGSVWSTPAAIHVNTQAEFFPALALDEDSTPVAAWCRVRDPDYTNTTDAADFLGQFDIVVASYDRDSATWSAAQTLNTNEYLNISPAFAQAADGQLALWWQSNPSNHIVGGTASSNSAPSEVW